MKKFLIVIILFVSPICIVFGQSSSSNDSIVYFELNIWTVIIYLILVISIFLNIFFFLKVESTKKKQKTDSVGELEDFYKCENKTLKNKIEKLEEDNTSLKNSIKEYKEKPISISNDEVVIKEEKTIDDEISPTFVFDIKQEQNLEKIIYLPPPFEERKFAVEDVSEIEKPLSLYVAEINSKTNRGTISLIESADLSRALNSPNLYLETVCDYENPYNSLAKGIKVITKGEIYLDGEDWVVKKKIAIKFI